MTSKQLLILLGTYLIAFVNGTILGQSFIDNCPLKIGDRVKSISTGHLGVVRDVQTEGSWSTSCRVAILLDGGQIPWQYDSEGKPSHYVYAWQFNKLGNKGG